MDSTLLASIIGGSSTIIAAVASPTIAAWIRETKKSKFTPLPPAIRQRSLLGRWNGLMDQQVGKPFLCNKHEMSLEFIQNGNSIEGTIQIGFTVSEGEKIPIDASFIQGKLINTIYDGRIIKTDYVNKNSNAIHFGTLYGELSSNGQHIEGEFLGFGLVSEMFVSGKFDLNKTKNL